MKVRVVSFTSWEIFEQQTEEYQHSVLPKDVKARLSVEMGVSQGWKKYVSDYGECLSIETFGASAPDNILFKEYGFTKENVIYLSRKILKNLS